MITQRYELIEEHRSGYTFYHLKDNYGKFSIDEDIYHCVYLLNQQDARIKVLEEENQQLKEKLKGETAEKEFWHSAYKGKQQDYDIVYAELRKTFDETEKLKQSQNQKAIEVLEKVIDFIRNADKRPEYWDISQFINNQIKELKGGKK